MRRHVVQDGVPVKKSLVNVTIDGHTRDREIVAWCQDHDFPIYGLLGPIITPDRFRLHFEIMRDAGGDDFAIYIDADHPMASHFKLLFS